MNAIFVKSFLSALIFWRQISLFSKFYLIHLSFRSCRNSRFVRLFLLLLLFLQSFFDRGASVVPLFAFSKQLYSFSTTTCLCSFLLWCIGSSVVSCFFLFCERLLYASFRCATVSTIWVFVLVDGFLYFSFIDFEWWRRLIYSVTSFL